MPRVTCSSHVNSKSRPPLPGCGGPGFDLAKASSNHAQLACDRESRSMPGIGAGTGRKRALDRVTIEELEAIRARMPTPKMLG
jgi:hypothetical protein